MAVVHYDYTRNLPSLVSLAMTRRTRYVSFCRSPRADDDGSAHYLRDQRQRSVSQHPSVNDHPLCTTMISPATPTRYLQRQRTSGKHKVHGTLLQRLRYLPYLGGAPFTVVRPPSNIAMYRCNVFVCRCNVPLSVAILSFALHCNAAHRLGVAPFTVPGVSDRSTTHWRNLPSSVAMF